MDNQQSNNPYLPPQREEQRAPKKVKYFGMFWIGAQTYFVLQSVAFVVMLGLLAAWYLVPVPAVYSDAALYKLAPWILGVGMAAELGETFVMWRKFQAPDKPE